MNLRLGIRGRLIFAFGALSALTFMVSFISWLSNNQLGDELNQVVEGNIHTLSLMADLKARGTTITLTAPTLLAVKTEEDRQRIKQQLNDNLATMSALLPQITSVTKDHETQKQLLTRIDALQQTLADLDLNVVDNLNIQQLKAAENQRLRWVASSFLSDIDSLIEHAQQDMFSRFSEDAPDSWIVLNQFSSKSINSLNADLQRLYRIKADVNLLVNLVDRAQHLPDLNSLVATQTYSDEIVSRIKQDLDSSDALYGTQALKQTVINIVYLSRGDNNMFTIRSLEREILQTGQLLLTQIGEQLDQVNTLIGLQTNKAETAAQLSAKNARETIRKGRIWMSLMVAVSVVLSIMLVWLYVGRNMVARITDLDSSMRAIANGNLEQQVNIKGNDEIGTMARSLVSFRDQLATLQEELVQAGKLAALGQLSAGIAHEINQPLSAIRHYAHNGVRLIQAERIEETEQNLQQISNLTKRATLIITRLKSLARKQQDNLVPVEISKAVENVLVMLEGDAIRHTITINIGDIDHLSPVLADQVQLEQVILNLITNAFDAMKNSDNKVIDINCLQTQDNVEIYVQDYGPGIDDESREHVFDPFFTTKRRGQNLGLGLSISFNIVKNFGGKLFVDTQWQSGASFCIQLPTARRTKS